MHHSSADLPWAHRELSLFEINPLSTSVQWKVRGQHPWEHFHTAEAFHSRATDFQITWNKKQKQQAHFIKPYCPNCWEFVIRSLHTNLLLLIFLRVILDGISKATHGRLELSWSSQTVSHTWNKDATNSAFLHLSNHSQNVRMFEVYSLASSMLLFANSSTAGSRVFYLKEQMLQFKRH